MDSEYNLGLPKTVIDLLKQKCENNNEKFTWKVFGSEHLTEVKLTWRLNTGERPGPSVRAVVCGHS